MGSEINAGILHSARETLGRGLAACAFVATGLVGFGAVETIQAASAAAEAPADPKGKADGGNSETAHENRGQAKKDVADETTPESSGDSVTDTGTSSTFSQPEDAGVNSKSPSTPDQDGIGADHGADNNDKTGPGTDPNNGCGNDPRLAAPRDGGRPTDDDNNGNCGGNKLPKPPVVVETCPDGSPLPLKGNCTPQPAVNPEPVEVNPILPIEEAVTATLVVATAEVHEVSVEAILLEAEAIPVLEETSSIHPAPEQPTLPITGGDTHNGLAGALLVAAGLGEILRRRSFS
ncbi:MAG: hypothetical protein V4702_04985 [Patescibacteria group bacterium]